MNGLSELHMIILELNRIASRRRFMRHRILHIADQLNDVAEWIFLAAERNIPIRGHLYKDLDEFLDDALDDLLGVIHYKKFMRRECWNVYKRLRSVKSYLYNKIVLREMDVNSDDDDDEYWLTHVFGCHKMVVR